MGSPQAESVSENLQGASHLAFRSTQEELHIRRWKLARIAYPTRGSGSHIGDAAVQLMLQATNKTEIDIIGGMIIEISMTGGD